MFGKPEGRPMFEPYDYQSDCLGRLVVARQEGKKKGLVVMASGLGKTVTVAFDVKQWRAQNTGRFLYLCDQNDILYQARTTFEAVLENSLSFGYFHGQEKKVHGMDGVFASFQTMEKHFGSFDPKEFPYVVVDESHHSHAETYKSVIDHFQPEWLFGVTATPDRMDGQDIRDIYGPELFYLPLEVAMADGLLTPVDYRMLTDEINLDGVLAQPGARLTVSDLNKRIFVPKRDDEIAGIIAQHAAEFADPRIIVFSSSLDRCDQLCQSLPSSLAIHSRLPVKERNVRTELFRQGLVNTVVTVDCFNEGIDIPQANVVVFLRSTESPNIFFQQLGRGLRRSEGKDRVIVLDFVANCDRIKMVQGLWKKVETERKNRESSGRSHSRGAGRTNLKVDQLQFNEKVVKVLDLLERLRPKYISEIPRLAREYSSKNEVPADRVYARTPAELWWKCTECDYEWLAKGSRRLQGSKCPACEGKVVTAENNLAACYPQLVKEYSPKNDLPATQMAVHSSFPLLWKCTDTQCGCEWVEIGASRVRRFIAGHGCPECYEQSSLNELSVEHPDVFQEYSAELNPLPSTVPWWKCSTCGYEWRGRTTGRMKGKGCPVCTGKVVTNETRLDLIYPSLATELVPGRLHIAQYVSVHSDRLQHWYCPYCAYRWYASPKKRIADRSCPRCGNPKKEGAASASPSIADHPALSGEYSGRNGVLAENMSQESHQGCWWVCGSCQFSYLASPHERLHEGVTCPVCTTLELPTEGLQQLNSA